MSPLDAALWGAVWGVSAKFPFVQRSWALTQWAGLKDVPPKPPTFEECLRELGLEELLPYVRTEETA